MQSLTRLKVLTQQLVASSSTNAPDKKESKAEMTRNFFQLGLEYAQSIHEFKETGTPPKMTAWELAVLQRRSQHRQSPSRNMIAKGLLEESAKKAFALSNLLPGPLRHASTEKEKIDFIYQSLLADAEGWNVQLWAEWQQKYGDRGLASNIVVPVSKPGNFLSCYVILADPEDSERIARIHTRKDGSFEPTLLDSVISTTDNDLWQQQRRQLSEVFLPLSSLAQVMPVSLARAKVCAGKLAEAAHSLTPVDMSDFLLHEAQAQLQLALLGLDEEFMERTNAHIRKTFMMHPDAKVGELSTAMAEVMKHAREDMSLSLPSDGRPIHGPLSRALQQSDFAPSIDYGNALLILFAGHDTTGHAMTWLLFELARHPEYQNMLSHL
jgi:hypothetical protein